MRKIVLFTSAMLLVSATSAMAMNVDCGTQRKLQTDQGKTVTDIISASASFGEVDHQATDKNGRTVTFLGPDMPDAMSFLAYSVGLNTDSFISETSDGSGEIWAEYGNNGCWRFAHWHQ